MTNLFLMDWNAKTPLQWDWDALLNGKAAEIPKKLRPADWGFEGEEGIDTGSLYSSGGGGGGGGGSGSGSGSGGTVSDVGRLSSSKSSKSASVDSSSIGKTSKSPFQELEGLHGDFHSKKELDKANSTGTSLTLETAVDSGEPLIGLKLGKRTYFEDFCAGSNAKSSSFSVTPMSSAPTAKRSRSSYQNTVAPRCQVEGCNLDISSAKDYHRKHKICESHSKCPKVIVNGLERRFCQQCSRFHGLEEFDEKKRSCRKRLSDHNARRRKPRQETIQFGSVRMSSALYDGRQQMGIELNQFPFVHARNPTWQSKSNSIFTSTKECTLLRPARTRGVDGQLHLPRNEPPNSVSMLYHDSKWLLPLKGGTSEGLNGGLEESMISTNLDATQDLRRALSLLSTNSWGSCQPVSVNNPMPVTNSTATNPVMHPVSEDLPLVASENWWTEQQSSDYQVHTFNSQSSGSTNFPEFQLFKGPYGSGSYSSQLN